MGILPLWATYEKEVPLPWQQKNLPLEHSPVFQDNLEWTLSLLNRVDKKHWINKEM